ncbi:MAG: DUF1893 domain-containing protein [Ruminococcus sp.]|nr:DUF1893 domain-containing protein [Ruminococcus sp.]
MNNLEKSKEILRDGNYTLVAVSDTETLTSTDRGVKPLLEFIDDNKTLDKFSVADKVIGKAGALLYVLLQPSEIFTNVISRPALELLESNNIHIEYNVLTDAIINRTGTGFCPMESTVRDTADPVTALSLIREKLKSLTK